MFTPSQHLPSPYVKQHRQGRKRRGMGKNLRARISLFAFPLPRAHAAAADPAWSPLLLPGHMEKKYRQKEEKGDGVKRQLKGTSRRKASWNQMEPIKCGGKREFSVHCHVGCWVSGSFAMEPHLPTPQIPPSNEDISTHVNKIIES